VTHRYKLSDGVVTDGGTTITRTDVRKDDLSSADAPVICGKPG
jgi:hypothetical protein